MSDMMPDPFDPFPIEDDARNILSWTEVSIREYCDLAAYYKQRLGPSTSFVPCVDIKTDFYVSLLAEQHDLLARLLHEDPEAAMEISANYVPRKEDQMSLFFSLENPDPGARTVAWLQRNASTDKQRQLADALKSLSAKCGQLHFEWIRKGRKYYKVRLPRRSSEDAERCLNPAKLRDFVSPPVG
jgi:hypothetical protein